MPTQKKFQISNFKFQINKGFTLIELLVVIAIIGILATFVVASFTSAQQRGRDARRKSDLDAIKKAVELAKQDSTGSAYYPGCDAGTNCNVTGTNTAPDLVPTYIRTVPSDPSSATVFYLYNPNATGLNVATTYALTACLENLNDPQRDAVDACAAAGTVSYTVNNP